MAQQLAALTVCHVKSKLGGSNLRLRPLQRVDVQKVGLSVEISLA
jgi:hypothetical protein